MVAREIIYKVYHMVFFLHMGSLFRIMLERGFKTNITFWYLYDSPSTIATYYGCLAHRINWILQDQY